MKEDVTNIFAPPFICESANRVAKHIKIVSYLPWDSYLTVHDLDEIISIGKPKIEKSKQAITQN